MQEDSKDVKVGLLSDTHGYLPDEVRDAFNQVNLIIHAGDVDRQDILRDLSLIAPVKAVRGNMDVGVWATSLPKKRIVQVLSKTLYILHDLEQLDVDPSRSRFDAIIHGHLHTPSLWHKHGVRYINPGSPTRPRGDASPSAAILHINPRGMNITFVSFN